MLLNPILAREWLNSLNGNVSKFGVLEYAREVYIFLAAIAIVFLSLKNIREYF